MNWKCKIFGHIIDWDGEKQCIVCARCNSIAAHTSQGLLWGVLIQNNNYNVQEINRNNDFWTNLYNGD